MRRIGIGGNRMIELKIIEKFMQDNGLEPYDVFMAEGTLENYSPLYFNEDLELRSMFLDRQNYEEPICIVLLYGLLTGLYPVRNTKVAFLLKMNRIRLMQINLNWNTD